MPNFLRTLRLPGGAPGGARLFAQFIKGDGSGDGGVEGVDARGHLQAHGVGAAGHRRPPQARPLGTDEQGQAMGGRGGLNHGVERLIAQGGKGQG